MIIDVAFFIIMIVAVYKGFSKGLIVAVFSLLAFIIGLAAALKLSVVVAHYLEFSSQMAAKWLPVLSFIIVFIIVSLLVNLGASIIKKAASIIMLGWLDKMGGILFHAMMYTIIFSVFLFFTEKLNLINPSTVAASSIHNYIAPWGPEAINNLGKIIPAFKDMFQQLQDFFENISHQFIE